MTTEHWVFGVRVALAEGLFPEALRRAEMCARSALQSESGDLLPAYVVRSVLMELDSLWARQPLTLGDCQRANHLLLPPLELLLNAVANNQVGAVIMTRLEKVVEAWTALLNSARA